MKRMKIIAPGVLLSFLAASSVVAPSAWAQPVTPEEPEEEKKEEGAKEEAKAGEEKTDDFARIADDEETIYAVQRKAYLINNKFEITVGGSLKVGDRFVQNFSVLGGLTYHLAENFGVELYGGYMFPGESGLTKEILREGSLTPERAKLTQMLWNVGVGVQWSPIYGKIHLFDTALGNFNFYLGAGAGFGQTRVSCSPGFPLDPQRNFENPNCGDIPEGKMFVYEPSTLRFIGSVSGGFRFYFNNFIGVKVEVRDYIFVARVFRPDEGLDDAVRNNVHLNLGVSFLLGGEDN